MHLVYKKCEYFLVIKWVVFVDQVWTKGEEWVLKYDGCDLFLKLKAETKAIFFFKKVVSCPVEDTALMWDFVDTDDLWLFSSSIDHCNN